MEWMILPYRRYFDFSGRSQRKEYWLFTLLWWIVLIVCMMAMFAGLDWAEVETPNAEPGPAFWLGIGLISIFVLGSMIPSIAVTVRRFHDQNMSGWFYLLGFIPYVGGLVVLVFMCIEGTRGENRWGHDPKGRGVSDVFA